MAARLFHYPFTSGATALANRYSVDKLLQGRALERARRRGLERVHQALDGEIRASPLDPELELLSHPYARMLLSCLNDPYLLRRYATAESKYLWGEMLQEPEETLLRLAAELGLDAKTGNGGLRVHFADYVALSAGMGGKWKLVNRTVATGYVRVSREELARLAQERIRERILQSLPLRVTPEIREALQPPTAQISPLLEARKKQMEAQGLIQADPQAFPPCIQALLQGIKTGLTHPGRFALTSFLWTVGLPEEEILRIYQDFPDYNEEVTLYQVRHIGGKFGAGTKYTPPGCAAMKTYGICTNPDQYCEKMNEEGKGHPLTYYRRHSRTARPPVSQKKTEE
ncbi:MAG: DNA primase large subunit PriL [Euryarchaeota archaeon]|nr:DNA primase large subunit PriL [Euryarchaeota archaeon]